MPIGPKSNNYWCILITYRNGWDTLPVFISSALDDVVGSGFGMSEFPLSSASPKSLFNTPFRPCFGFLFGVLFPLTLGKNDYLINSYLTSKLKLKNCTWNANFNSLLNWFLIPMRTAWIFIFLPRWPVKQWKRWIKEDSIPAQNHVMKLIEIHTDIAKSQTVQILISKIWLDHWSMRIPTYCIRKAVLTLLSKGCPLMNLTSVSAESKGSEISYNSLLCQKQILEFLQLEEECKWKS